MRTRWVSRSRASGSGMPGLPCAAGAARGEERVELLLEADRLGHPELERWERRFDHTVEDQRADVGREQVRVRLAEQRAVGHPEEGQLLVADGLAELLEVPGDVGRADEAEQRTGGPGARLARSRGRRRRARRGLAV